jgi:lipopolysaccharide heptosyltransferase II
LNTFLKTEQPLRFLVIRTDRMGDVILSTPVLTAIKQSFPKSKVAMLVRPYAHELVAGHPDLDEIIFDDDDGQHRGATGLLRLAAKLRVKLFDVALVLHPIPRLALITFLARIPLRVGSGFRVYSFLFNKRVYHHRKHSQQHELDLNLEVAQAIGINLKNVVFKFHIPQEAKEKISHHLHANVIDKQPFVVIHPGSGSSARDWPPEKFGQLAFKLMNELEAYVVITGTDKERYLVDQVQEAAGIELSRLDGCLKIKELAALLQAADLVIANSTGPLHLAVAVGTEVIGLFCPIEPCLPSRWGPYKPGTRTWQTDSVIMPAVSLCKKCIGDNCSDWDCMNSIPVSQVYDLAQKKLEAIALRNSHSSTSSVSD